MLIEFKDVCFTYLSDKGVEVKALNHVNFKISKGSFNLVVGRSGSGKTTLLYALSGLIKIGKGEIIVDGHNIANYNKNELSIYRNKTLGFIFQNFFLENGLTVIDNVILPLLISKVPISKAKEKAKEILDKVGLINRINHYPSELSGGEKQRVAIARALVNDPLILIADEPTGNLDTENGQLILDILKDLVKEGKTLILVSHDLSFKQYADQIINIKDGFLIDD